MRNFNENYSLVRALHAVVGGDTVDIYLNGNPFFYNIKFTDFTPYVYVPEGKYTVEVFPRDQKENPIVPPALSYPIKRYAGYYLSLSPPHETPVPVVPPTE